MKRLALLVVASCLAAGFGIRLASDVRLVRKALGK